MAAPADVIWPGSPGPSLRRPTGFSDGVSERLQVIAGGAGEHELTLMAYDLPPLRGGEATRVVLAQVV